MKKIVLMITLVMIFTLTGCDKQEADISMEDISQISSVLEESSGDVSAILNEVSEFVESEEVSEMDYSEEEEFLKGLTAHTMWIQSMTAKEAVLNSIWGGDYSDDTPATVVGMLLQTSEEGEQVSSTHTVTWCTLENDEYVELNESTSHGTSPICGDELAVVIGRFPADKVDINNLYLQISSFSGESVKYFKVEPDNLFDIYSLEASENVTGEKGEIVYFHDIPFIITASPWNNDVVYHDYDVSNYMKREDPAINNDKTITLMPLTGQLTYDFSFYNTAKLSENYDSAEYAVLYTTRWDDQDMVGTIEGNRVNLCFDYLLYYEQDDYDAYRAEYGDYNTGGFFDMLKEAALESELTNTYLEMENTNRPNTKLYFLQ